MKSYNKENQKLRKRIASLFVIVAMVLTCVVPAFAADDNVVSVSSITFDDGEGNIVQSLDGLSKVRAQVTVRTKSSQKMVFVLALYGENNKLLAIDREAKRATSSGTTFTTTIEYDIPENAEGYKLNAFLVDNVKDMNALARGSLFPSGNLDLCNLYVTIDENEPVDLLASGTPKDGVFKVDVPLNIEFAPSVKAVPVDNGTKVEVAPPTFFPGYSEVTLTATNGATKTYKIEYVAKNTINSLTGYVGTNFHAADDTDEDYGSVYFNDRATPAYNGSDLAYYNDVRSISDEWDYLKGSMYYKAAVGDYTNPSYKSDRSTTVRVFGTGAITGDGWTSETSAKGHIIVSHTMGAGVEGHTDYKEALKMTVVSSKTFPAGTVTLPAISKSFLVVVEPAQYVPESYRAFSTESIKVNGNYVDTSAGPGTYDVPLSSGIIYAPEVTEADIAFSREYEGRTVEITNPTSFPGQTVIKVAAGEDSAEYVLKYSLDGLVTNASSNLGTNFHAADDENAVESAGYLRGSRFFMDRNDATIYFSNDPSKGVGYFNDIRSISSEYDFLNGSPYFMTSAGGALNTKFTVGREADAYIFLQTDASVTGTDGWTKSTNSNGYLTISSSAGEGVPASACVEAKPLEAAKMTIVYHKKLAPGDSVDITPSTNKAIIVVKFKGYIEQGLTLTDLAVDGRTVAGFSSDRTDYKVELPADTLICPEVTAEADDPDTQIEITKPTTFPGKATVKLTYGDKSKVFTITYTTGDLISNVSGAIGKDFHAADDANATYTADTATGTVFARGSKLYSNRTDANLLNKGYFNYFNDIRTISDEYDYLNGTDFFSSAVGGATAKFTVNRNAVIRVFTNNGNMLSTANGWTKETKLEGYMTASTTSGQGLPEGYNPNEGVTVRPNCVFTEMFYKTVTAGTTVDVALTTQESILVIDYAGYIEAGAMLSDLAVDGETVEGFNMTKNDYTVEIDAGALIAPVVTATAFVDGSDVEITNPTTFPGKATVKVTNGDMENTYTITYTSGDLISNASREAGKNFHAAEGDGLGSQLFSDRGCPAPAIGGGVAYYNDIRAISDDWKYLTGTDYFMSAVGARNVTFTLNRAAVVRVFSDSTNAVSGWDKATLSDGYYMAASTTTGQFTEEGSTKFNTMFYKKYYAGDTVTLSPAVMTSVIVIDYDGYMEGASALLSGIEVNGEALEGFAMNKTDYTVEIAPDTVAAPVVTATAAFEGTEVEIIEPASFPGKTVIRVTLGGDEKEYTIRYTTSDLVASASKAVGRDFHAADDANATTSGEYKLGSLLFSDRGQPVTNAAGLAYYNDIRKISDDWDYLNGTDFFSTAVAAGSRPVTFTLNRAATVRVFAEGTSALSEADGWTKETNADGYMLVSYTSGHIDDSTCAKFGCMYYKEIAAGEEITVSPTVRDFIVVIDYAGYGEVEEVPADYAALTDITIDGVSIDGFDAEVNDYAYEIAPDTMVIPEIVATAVNPDSEVEVINPGMGDNPNVFPGKTIIVVRNGEDEREYTIQYTYTGLSAITGMSSTGGRTDFGYFGSNFHEPGDFDEAYGSRLYYDRTSVPAYSGSTLAYYNDVREICDEMDYLKGTDYIMANRNQAAKVNHTFTLLRPATVRVFHLSGYNSGNATLEGWTTETKEGGFVKVSHTLGAGVEGHANYNAPPGLGAMTYKEFGAGEEVSINSPGDYAIVVIDYMGYDVQ